MLFSPPNNKQTGRIGEQLACKYLKKKGLFIWETNWSTKTGELDIIARDKRQLVIIEVKSRRLWRKTKITEEKYPQALYSYSEEKQKKIEKLVDEYRYRNIIRIKRERAWHCRIDLIAIDYLLHYNCLPQVQQVLHVEGVC